jgi:hypothetical protein
MACIHGFNKRTEMEQRMHYDSARLVAQVTAQMGAKKGVRVKPTDIATFPWDEKAKRKSYDEPPDIDAVMMPFVMAGGN